MHSRQFTETATAFLSLLLLMAADSAKFAAAGRSQPCASALKQSLKLTRLVQEESVDLIKTYKASQGEMSELFCKATVSNIPDPTISGLEPSERIASIYTQLLAFFPHFRRVYEQQRDLQFPKSPLLPELAGVRARSRNLAVVIDNFHRSLFPNVPAPDPAGGPTALPPSQNVFQQKVYGCVVLKTFKEFLSNVSRELKALKSKVCRRRIQKNRLFGK